MSVGSNTGRLVTSFSTVSTGGPDFVGVPLDFEFILHVRECMKKKYALFFFDKNRNKKDPGGGGGGYSGPQVTGMIERFFWA